MKDTFPKYRKYVNGQSFFKIISNNAFEEVKKVGSKFILYKVDAKIYPDKVYIQDMLKMSGDIWQEITPEEYKSALRKVS